MNNFQTILVAIFLGAFVFAVLIFSGAIKIGPDNSNKNPEGKIIIWGTLPKSSVSSALDQISSENTGLSIKYEEKSSSNYQNDLIESFALGKAPDLFIITPDMIKRNEDFIYKISYDSLSKKTFMNSYIDGASVYLDDDGIIGYPILVDPIVLYYNKDILLNRNIVYPPKTWDELFSLNSSLTKSDNVGSITESMIALGGYNNVNNAKDIISALLLQNNNNIVIKENGSYKTVLGNNPNNLSVTPAEAVVTFYTEFSNQSRNAYSWNSSLPNSLDMFTSSKLAFYLGKASELFKINSVNPNLSFNVDQIPQIKDSKIRVTFGNIYGVVINKKSSNLASAFKVSASLASDSVSQSLSISTSLPPASRSLLNKKPKDNQYLQTFFESSLISKSWNDPDYQKTNEVFKEMISNVLSNSLSISEALNKAQDQLNQILK